MFDAPFPLTPTLSPRRGRSFPTAPKIRDASTGRRGRVAPSPWGEGERTSQKYEPLFTGGVTKSPDLLSRDTQRWRILMNTILALSGVVIKELYRRKDFYVLFVLTAVITLLLGLVSFFNDPKIARYLKEVVLLLIWVAALVIAITTAARQIPAERENRTIFPLLAKPVSRGQVIVGKFLGCWLACGLALLVFYVFFGVVSGSREHSWPVLNYFQGLWL